ncbi:MAG: amino acid hydroxylase, partial [Pseudomonadota bacterium]
MSVATTQADIVASLPVHLRPFVQLQDHAEQYCPRVDDVWSLLLRALSRCVRLSANPLYFEGMRRTGFALYL